MQKFPAEVFMATTKLEFKPNMKLENERAGLVVMGRSYASIGIKNKKNGLCLFSAVGSDADKGKAESETIVTKLNTSTIYLRVTVTSGAKCQFSYSLDGITFIKTGNPFQSTAGQWIGAKVGLFAVRDTATNDSGSAEYDWFRIEAVK